MKFEKNQTKLFKLQNRFCFSVINAFGYKGKCILHKIQYANISSRKSFHQYTRCLIVYTLLVLELKNFIWIFFPKQFCSLSFLYRTYFAIFLTLVLSTVYWGKNVNTHHSNKQSSTRRKNYNDKL